MPSPISGGSAFGPRATVLARVALGLFFSVFLAAGLGLGAVFAGRPILSMIDALGWTATTCEILSSRVGSGSGDAGSTYRVEVSYRYEASGATRIGHRYKFVSGYSSGRSRKVETVRRLSPGTVVECWVNPDDPRDSVIVRGPTGDLAFAIIPLLFVLVGAGGVAAAFRRGPIAALLAPRAIPTHMTYESARAARRSVFTRLVPLQTRRTKLLVLLFIALTWNGLVSAFLYQIVQSWRDRYFAIPMLLFMIPFVLVGTFLIVIAAMSVMQYFNPVPHLIANAKVLGLGEELQLKWMIEGGVEKLRHLKITLEGREEARYRRGTDTHVDTETFASFTLVDQAAPLDPGGGKARVTIPATTMHSFESSNNKIAWHVKVHGDLRNWPDIEDEFPVQVTPAR